VTREIFNSFKTSLAFIVLLSYIVLNTFTTLKNDKAINTKELEELEPTEIMNGIHEITTNLKDHLRDNDLLWEILYFVYLTHNPFRSLSKDEENNINEFMCNTHIKHKQI
jgi:hypothetical protein